MQVNSDKQARASRRSFIGRAVVTGGAATVAMAAGAARHDLPVADGTHSTTDQALPGSGYRETAHVARYYRLARS